MRIAKTDKILLNICWIFQEGLISQELFLEKIKYVKDNENLINDNKDNTLFSIDKRLIKEMPISEYREDKTIKRK